MFCVKPESNFQNDLFLKISEVIVHALNNNKLQVIFCIQDRTRMGMTYLFYAIYVPTNEYFDQC